MTAAMSISMPSSAAYAVRRVKPREIDRALSLVSGNAVRPFCVIQRGFYRYDLGDGLVAVALGLLVRRCGRTALSGRVPDAGSV